MGVPLTSDNVHDKAGLEIEFALLPFAHAYLPGGYAGGFSGQP